MLGETFEFDIIQVGRGGDRCLKKLLNGAGLAPVIFLMYTCPSTTLSKKIALVRTFTVLLSVYLKIRINDHTFNHFRVGSKVVHYDRYGPGTGPFLISEVDCGGEEASLTDCSLHTSGSCIGNAVAIQCAVGKICTSIQVKIYIC